MENKRFTFGFSVENRSLCNNYILDATSTVGKDSIWNLKNISVAGMHISEMHG